jgi:tetrahydromethanopterin S-methyltransferase subunit A
MVKDETTVEKLTLKIDTEDVQKIVDDALETVQKAQEASELEKVVQSTSEELKAAVEATKKVGRPAKAK